MLEAIKAEVTKILLTVQIKNEQQVETASEVHTPVNVQYQHATYEDELTQEQQATPEKASQENKTKPFVRKMDKVGRNDPCPCGSGKKYKQCHGKLK